MEEGVGCFERNSAKEFPLQPYNGIWRDYVSAPERVFFMLRGIAFLKFSRFFDVKSSRLVARTCG